MLDWQTQGTINRGTDVETKQFLLNKKGKLTWKSDKYHQKMLREISEKSPLYFFFCF